MTSVVVTGVGVVTAHGRGLPALARAIAEDRFCGSPGGTALPVEQVGRVTLPVPDHPDFPDDRKAALFFLALEDALAAAEVEDEPETAVFLGTGLSSVTPRELEEDVYPHLCEGALDLDAMARDLHALLVLLPFERDACVAEGIHTTWIGR